MLDSLLRTKLKISLGRFFSLRLNLNRCKSSISSSPITSNGMRRILNVAEKNDAAKTIAGYLSGGNIQKREGKSVYNKIYEFTYNFRGSDCRMIMTSVSGHLTNLDFVSNYRGWNSCSPEELFDAPIATICPDNYKNIKETLEREIRNCDSLIIWTDCDREGENIGYEIINVCTAVNRRINVFRATFSEITRQSIKRAMDTLGQPNKLISDAVEVRKELDLRIGAAFTRFQTLRLQRVFPQALAENLISYGSCQFPTLGFVVERYKAARDFLPEKFWKIKVSHRVNNLNVEFLWERVRLFDQLFCQVLFDKCREAPIATVTNVVTKPKSKWRPIPLDTVELEKISSRKLKINAKETMRIAERLYTRGFISYPRTETNIFPSNLNLNELVQQHEHDSRWGQFARNILNDGPTPRQGRKSDQAHPPIHPTKHTDQLNGDDKKVYEYIVRHFLACLSKDAEGMETKVNILINGETFIAHGLRILALNYLEVYPYEKWNAKEIHAYSIGQTFTPTNIDLTDGQTTAPDLLTEADLIALMEKHGIGTDATHAEHIETIKDRDYVGLVENKYFVPGKLGIGLVDGYDSLDMQFEMSKPKLRALLEADLKSISEGAKNPRAVLDEQIAKYREVFRVAVQQARKIDAAVSKYLETQAEDVGDAPDAINLIEAALKCARCGGHMIIKSREGRPPFLTCTAFPSCKHAIWFSEKVVGLKLTPDACPTCGSSARLMEFTFRPGSMAPFYQNVHIGCVAGCDAHLLDALNISGAPSSNNSRSNSQPDSRSDTVGFSRLANDFQQYRNDLDQSRGGDNVVQCNCGLAAKKFKVSKESANKGREFYTCSKSSVDSDRCQFFLWADAASEYQPDSRNVANRSTFADPNRTNVRHDNGEGITCNCGLAAKKFTVQKESVNKGRQFYVCAKPVSDSDRCKFYLWADENATASAVNSPSTANTSYRAKNRYQKPAATRNDTSRTSSARKCGLCKREGHTRNRCPEMDRE